MDGKMEGCVYGWMEIDEWKDGWMDGWMDACFTCLGRRHVLARRGGHVGLQHGVAFQADVDVVQSCQGMGRGEGVGVGWVDGWMLATMCG